MNVDEARVRVCRLDPAFALDVFDDAVAFLDDRGVLTQTPCCSIPSLFGACHEEPHSPGKRGYGTWPKTRWWWGGALGNTEGVTVAKLHRGKNVFLSREVADIVDPLCREELARAMDGALGAEATRIVRHLDAAGPSTTDDLKRELGLDGKAFHRGRDALLKRGAVLARSFTEEAGHDGHRHSGELRCWDHVATTVHAHPLGALLRAVVAAAVVLPVAEATSALTWRLPAEADGVERLRDGRLTVTDAAYR